MTVATEYAPQRYTGNGVTTTFAFPYIFFNATDLIVTLTLISTGANTVQVLNTDYTVTGGNGTVGNVVFTVAPSSLYRVTIELSLPYTQQDDYVENQAFPADTLESGLDRAAIRDQQLRSLITGSLKFPATLASSYDGLLPAPENGKILTWSGITGQVANASLADISISLNTIITSPTSGQVLTWDGINWINGVVGYFGSVSVLGTSSQSAYITLAEDTDNGTNTIKIQAPASVSSNKTITFPDNTGTVALLSDVVSTPPRNHIDGYQMSTAGSSTTMAIGAGQAANSTNAVYITLVSSLNKTTSSWAVGTGNGGLDTGTIANNTWYHFYAIRRPDTGVVDVVFSTNATSPTLPTNYTQFRRIGARRTNGSGQWDSFTQIGDLFIINTPILDVNDGASGTTDKTGTLTNVPTGVNTLVNANVSIGNNGNHAYISALSSAAAASSLSAAPLTSVVNVLNGTSVTPYPVQFLADTNAQFRYRTLSSSTFLLSVLSYVDLRGKQ